MARPHCIVALLVVALGAIGCDRRTAPARPYNVLLLSLDTVRQDLLGVYGRRPVHAPTTSPSPALDRLAAEGVRMMDAYAPSSWTLPSHISLLTGQPPLVHGIESEAWTLDPATPTLGTILRQHGYRTRGFYSAPYLAPHWGFDRGFDSYEPVYGADLRAAAARAADVRARIEKAAAARDWKQYDELKWSQVEIEDALNNASERAVTSEELADRVVAELDTLAGGSEPWLVFAHFFDAHCDYVPPAPWDRRFDPDYTGRVTGIGCLAGPEISSPSPDRPGAVVRAIGDRDLAHVVALYEGEMAWVDANVGKILDALRTRGLTEHTLVVVVSDHGEEFFEHDNLGHRHTLYEESIRVPLLLRLPSALPANASVRGPVSLSDVLPTILEILGLPHDGGAGSSSFLPLIRDGRGADERSVLARLVMMFGGHVQVEGSAGIDFRQVMVQDVFRTGPIKITRTRRWPQFPSAVAPEVRDVLQREAAAQYAREEVHWIDVERFPDEPADRQATSFADAAARTALERFNREYTTLVARRSRRHDSSPLPESMRRNLESLGYVDTTPGPLFPEPDVLLPPPPAG